jgi:hypothetical protein
MFDGQSNVACCAGVFVPTGKVRVCDTGGGTKFAVAVSAEFIVTAQLVPVPELAHAPPHPPNVVGEVAFSVKVTTVPPV